MTEPTQQPSSASPAPASAPPAASASVASPPSPPTASESQPPAPAAAAWDAEKNEIQAPDLTATLSDYQKFKADEAARIAATPKTADGYKAELPKEFKLPEGYILDDKNPLVGALREAALESGLPQEVFSKVLAKGAAAMATADKAQRDSLTAAMAKRDEQLGAKAGERIEGLKSFFKTVSPDPKVQAQLEATLWTPDIVRVFETWAGERAKQGAHSFTQSGRETTASDGKPANWETMSALDKRTWQLTNQRAAGGK
jgi:hypothetical protein